MSSELQLPCVPDSREERLSLRSKIWSIETEYSSDRRHSVRKSGGGICIRPDGLILSVEHVVPRNCRFICVRRVDELGSWRNCRFFRSFPQVGISLFFVGRVSEDEVFEFIDVPQVTDVQLEDEVFAYLQGARFFSGRVAYPYVSPEFDALTLKVENHTIASLPDDVTDKLCAGGFEPYRTAGGVIDRRTDGRLVSLTPDLPLIQISGFGVPSTEASGESGYPLFKSEGSGLVGIIIFVKGGCELVIPADFVNWFMKSLGDIVRPSKSPTTRKKQSFVQA